MNAADAYPGPIAGSERHPERGVRAPTGLDEEKIAAKGDRRSDGADSSHRRQAEEEPLLRSSEARLFDYALSEPAMRQLANWTAGTGDQPA